MYQIGCANVHPYTFSMFLVFFRRALRFLEGAILFWCIVAHPIWCTSVHQILTMVCFLIDGEWKVHTSPSVMVQHIDLRGRMMYNFKEVEDKTR